MSIYDYPEGTTAVCWHCGESILLDQVEGGGEGMDWGAGPEDWPGNGGIGMDYGCNDSPETDDEGCGGHEPNPSTVKEPDRSITENAKDWEGWDDFVAGYIACALWLSYDEDEDNLDLSCTKDDLSADALKSIEDDCAAFMFHNYRKLQRVGTMAQHGHDFWLTRNRHGAGFWDRGYGDLGKDLTDKAHTYGSSDLYVGDDGKVEVS